MMGPSITWSACSAPRPGKAGRAPCCVHVEDHSRGFEGKFLSFFCCWCGTAVPHPQAPVPTLPEPPGAVATHGPLASGCRAARHSDLDR